MTTVTAGYDTCPDWAPFLGYLGASSCVILANFGSAWGTWASGIGVCKMGITYPAGIMKNIVPIVMAGVLGIYGLIVAVIIAEGIKEPSDGGYNTYSVFNGYTHLAAGLCCGLSCLAAGGTIGAIGKSGTVNFGAKAGQGQRGWMHHVRGDNSRSTSMQDDVGPDAAGYVEDANRLYVGFLIMLIFAEAIALYGLIVALILSQKTYDCGSA
mmetsp:Transcript_6179/g.9000  ORF Transcript_6179/g.9000 Transcript_6179/m.9000 type:complete len:211 (-) Transcript_6179:191-823(-)|eukprot:CAMPEP_0196802556 /NCGR_PEP_ID=MMETSP1362-20130617/2150_1 /TAXON_ID=163516 /ORGANISM="Leptocylindrus danicus, Strain CCMP1856" /LENGTH=210 /DNA_ID=CAMNT_0042173881 /DNA_START=90 /DNA_END=722 /DNA_ORIENTATION=+